MKHRRILSFLTCVAFVASLLPAAGAWAGKGKKVPVPGPSATTGSLQVICAVNGAGYVIDEGSGSEVKGTTPVAAPIVLPPGPHTIRVTREGYLPFSDVFDIRLGETTELEIEMVLYSGKLRVTASPPPVDVQVDEKSYGPAPLTLDLSIGEHVVRLSKFGYVDEIKKVNVKTGQTTDLDVALLAVAEAQKRAGGGPIYKKWWFWTVIGTVVAGAAVSTVVVLKMRNKSEPAKFDGTLSGLQ